VTTGKRQYLGDGDLALRTPTDPHAWVAGLVPSSLPAAQLATRSPAESAREYAAAAIPPNTERAYAGQWAKFVTWCGRFGYASLPAKPRTVADFIGYSAAEGASPATIEVMLAAIAKRHELAQLANPRDSIEVRVVRSGIRRKHGVAQVGRAALTVELLRDLVRSLQGVDASSVRDRALLLVGFAGAFRRSELAGLNWGDLKFQIRGMMISLRRSKTDQEGKGRLVGVAYGQAKATCPVKATLAWYEVLRAQGEDKPRGAIFRSIEAGRIGGRLDGRDVGRILKRHLVKLGYDARGFGAHSLRVGFVTAAIAAGKSRTAIKRQTGHRSDEMVDRYARPVELFDDNPSDGIGL